MGVHSRHNCSHSSGPPLLEASSVQCIKIQYQTFHSGHCPCELWVHQTHPREFQVHLAKPQSHPEVEVCYGWEVGETSTMPRIVPTHLQVDGFLVHLHFEVLPTFGQHQAIFLQVSLARGHMHNKPPLASGPAKNLYFCLRNKLGHLLQKGLEVRFDMAVGVHQPLFHPWRGCPSMARGGSVWVPRRPLLVLWQRHSHWAVDTMPNVVVRKPCTSRGVMVITAMPHIAQDVCTGTAALVVLEPQCSLLGEAQL